MRALKCMFGLIIISLSNCEGMDMSSFLQAVWKGYEINKLNSGSSVNKINKLNSESVSDGKSVAASGNIFMYYAVNQIGINPLLPFNRVGDRELSDMSGKSVS